MKKFLTVLLALSVVFTYSFATVGTAFAYSDEQLQNVVDSHEKAVKAIQDKYDENLKAINASYSSKLADKTAQGNNDADAWKAACDVALDLAKATLNKELAEAWNELANQEKLVTDPKGWDLGTGAVETGYVNVAPALAKLTTATITVDEANVGESAFNSAMAKTVALIKNYDLDQFVKDDDFNNTGKSSYQTAVDAQKDALALLASYKYPTKGTQDIYAVYKIEGVGTLGETESGSFYDAIKDLKTTAVAKTDEAKIDYAKTEIVKDVKALIEQQRTAELKVQNDIIFKQSVSAKPNQDIIDDAKEEIEKINAKYDAYLEVWTYRLENGTYKVENQVNSGVKYSYINLYYGEDKIAYLASFVDDVFTKTNNTVAYSWAKLTDTLSLAKGEEIVKYVKELKEEAADLKATIAVDGNTYIDVDEVLADAIMDTYMTGVKGTLPATLANDALHARVHQLIGDNCKGIVKTDKVTVNGKKYDNVSQWVVDGYSPKNTDAVKAIKADAKEAIKGAKTIAEAETAFVSAYEKYDAVLNIAEQNALFGYNGELYKKDTAAKAELSAYVDYKVALMDLTNAEAVKEAIKDDIEDNLLTEVNNEADLNSAVAEYKAFIDNLKTVDELKAEDKALRDKIVALKRPVTVEQKAEVIALYDEYLAFDKYCTKVAYENTESDAVKTILESDVKRIAGLEEDAMDDLVAEINKDGITLADRENIKALVEAMDAYNDLYPEYEIEGVGEYTTTKDYEAELFKLDVEAAEKLIAALPANGATSAQIREAKDAVKALGYEGICELGKTPAYLAKLNRLDQNLMYDVKALKITASSVAKKGSITVKWVVKGNSSSAEAYEIWKSTKKSSGFSKSFTTKDGTKRTYKNTKGLKKGTRYYYKVRAIAYDADGNKVTSDWSNKAYRVAK